LQVGSITYVVGVTSSGDFGATRRTRCEHRYGDALALLQKVLEEKP